MIRVRVEYGMADRVAPVVSDDLISDIYAAKARAIQELYKHVKVHHTRTLAVAHNPDLEVGEIRPFVYPELGISGGHRVVSFQMDITPESVNDQVVIEQLSDMPGR